MELDSEQRLVVDYEDSCLVVAGPGSGKTRTLVAKAQKLWEDNKDLICLTFTRAAAQELRDRMPGIKAQTIHSYCHEEVGWLGNYDKLLYAYLDRDGKYQYEWVLCDEVQDLTEEELEVVLSIRGDKLFMVGDPYQSIYGWNGALGMKVFDKLKDIGRFELKNNYRSSPIIVEWLNSIYPRGLVSSNIVRNGVTAILARTNRVVWEVTQILEEANIGYTVRVGASELVDKKEEFCGSDTLKVMTCHCSKGLEFDRVILHKWYPEPFWGEEKNIYYVAVARASLGFCSTWTGSRLLGALKG